MQIFLIGNVLETAKCLDSRRLNKQIIEVKQIISASNFYYVNKVWKEYKQN